jgi:hypothetical protein
LHTTANLKVAEVAEERADKIAGAHPAMVEEVSERAGEVGA